MSFIETKTFKFTCDKCKAVKTVETDGLFERPAGWIEVLDYSSHCAEDYCEKCAASKFDDVAHPKHVSEIVLQEAENYAISTIENSKLGLVFNQRYLLSMIRELRQLREVALRAGNALGFFGDDYEAILEPLHEAMNKWDKYK